MIDRAPQFEPDFEIPSPDWVFEDGYFISGNIRISIIDAPDSFIENSEDAQTWLTEPF